MSHIRRLGAAEIDRISRTPLFEGLRPDAVSRLLAEANLRHFDTDTLLFSAGDLATRFYILLSGNVRLFALTAGGQHSVVDVISGLRSFAEAAMFASRRYPLNAEAEKGCVLVQVDAKPFLRALAASPELVCQMMANLERWERHILDEIGRLKFMTPLQRLSAFLLGLTGATEGEAHLRLPLRKATLASRIGIEPESLSRALQRLETLGVECHGNEIHIEDLAALRSFCGGATGLLRS